MTSTAPAPAQRGAPSPVLSPVASELHLDDPRKLERTLKREWKKYRKQLAQCRKKFTARGVHELRVETRRLLSSLGLFADWLPPKRLARIGRSLKNCLDLFDDLRDTQVQLAALASSRSRASAAGLFYRYLKKRRQRFTKTARKGIRKARISRLEEDISCCRKQVAKELKQLPSSRASALILGAVDQAFERTLHLQRNVNAEDTASIHKTRVAFKRFRYMVERLAGHLPGISRELLVRMRRYQTLMGEIQDAEVMMRAFEKYSQKHHLAQQITQRFNRIWIGRRDRRIHAYLRAKDEISAFWPIAPPAPFSDN